MMEEGKFWQAKTDEYVELLESPGMPLARPQFYGGEP
jgi:hypothetical protein